MNTVMRAKFIVDNVEQHKDGNENVVGETLRMSAVSKTDGYDNDGLDEDNTFAHFSPSGDFNVYIANKNLHGKFEVGEKYYMDFTKAES